MKRLIQKNIASSSLGLAMLFLASTGWVSYRNTIRLFTTDKWVKHTYIVLEDIKDVASGLKDTERGRKAYIITKDKTFLTTFNNGEQVVQHKLRTLRQLTTDNPRQQQRLDELQPLIIKRLASLQNSINLRQKKPSDFTSQITITEQDQALQAQVQKVLDQMEAQERQLLQRRRLNLEDIVRNTIILLAGGYTLSVGLLIGFFLLLQQRIRDRQHSEQALRASEERWQLAITGNKDGIWDRNIQTNQTFRSSRFMEILGEDKELGSSRDELLTRIHPDDVERVIAANRDYLDRKIPHYDIEYRLRCKDNTYKWVMSRGQAQWDEQGKPVRMVGSLSDITPRKQAEAEIHRLNAQLEARVKERTAQLEASNHLLLGQKQVLEMLAKGASLPDILNVLIQIIERHSPQMCCSLLLLDTDGKTLRLGTAPSLPNDHNKDINLALSCGLRACWSKPILSNQDKVLGTFFIYYHEPRHPSLEDLELIETSAHLAEIAIEHKQIEQERSRLVKILETTSDHVGFGTPQGKVLWNNAQAKKWMGLDSNADVSKLTFADYHPPWALEIIQNQGIPTAIRDGTWVGETALLNYEGQEIPVSQMIIAHKAADGTVEYFSTIIRDITERKQTEAALQESYNLLQTVIDSNPNPIFVKDLQGRYLLMNAPGANLFNKSLTQILGQDDSVLFPSEVCAKIKIDENKILSSGRCEVVEDTVLIHGQWRTYLTTKNVYRDAEGNILGLVGFARDITYLKRTQAVLRESEKRFRATFEQAAVGIAHVNPEGQFLRMNQKFCDLLGYTSEEMLMYKFQEISYADDLEVDLECLQLLLADEIQTYSLEKRFIRKDKSLMWANLTVSLVHDASGEPKYIIGVIQDITTLKETQEALLQINQELEQRVEARTAELSLANFELTRSNQELEQFAYVASHDLREPLRKIKSYTDLLVRRYQGKLDEKGDKYIAYISDGAVRMQTLITDLLTYSRVGRGEISLVPIDLGVVLKQTLNDLSTAIEESNAIIVTDPLPTVQANPTQMGQLFQNLIANAIKFQGLESPQIQIRVLKQDETWTISIQDNGIGIEPQYADRIFVIFQRLHTKDEYPGTGIGLAVCKKIVERHGGKIWLESELGRGTTFFFTLPNSEAHPQVTSHVSYHFLQS